MKTTLDIAASLEAARVRLGISKQDLALQAGLSRQSVFRLFAGADVQLTTMLAIANALRLDIVALPSGLSAQVAKIARENQVARVALGTSLTQRSTRDASSVTGVARPGVFLGRATTRDSASVGASVGASVETGREAHLSAVQMRIQRANERLQSPRGGAGKSSVKSGKTGASTGSPGASLAKSKGRVKP